MKNKLFILGAGAWGSALALVAAQHQNEIFVWDHDPDYVATLNASRQNEKYLPGFHFPENIHFTSEFAIGMQEATDILVVVPSHVVRDVLSKIKKFWQPNIGISVASKGLDPTTQKFFHETVSEIFGSACEFGALSGPSFAKEVAQQLPTAVTFATQSDALAKRMLTHLALPHFRIYQSDDVMGVQLGGVCKNVIAIASGISDGLKLGANARSALITRGLAEMSRLGRALGAKSETLAGLSGVGDLILTCTDNQSRNRRFGQKIGEGLNTQQAIEALGCLVEGWYNVDHLRTLAAKHHVTLPITLEVYEILFHHKQPSDSLLQLLSRDLKLENDVIPAPSTD